MTPTMIATSRAARLGRACAALRQANAAVPAAPRWTRAAAHLVPLIALPSGLWRIAAVDFHAPLIDHASSGDDALGTALGMPAWFYVALLTLVSELVASLAVGLVARWGEIVPAWVPRLGGRRIPLKMTVVVAAAGSVVLTVLWTTAWVSMLAGDTIRGGQLPADNPIRSTGWRLAAFVAAYLPLLLWGPLLGALTVAYWRRRRAATGIPVPEQSPGHEETACTAT
jgi:hypothetical protein